VEKAIKGLAQNGITSDLNERRDIALYHLKAAGEFDPAMVITSLSLLLFSLLDSSTMTTVHLSIMSCIILTANFLEAVY
jgi:hypothetical protein